MRNPVTKAALWRVAWQMALSHYGGNEIEAKDFADFIVFAGVAKGLKKVLSDRR